MILRKASWLLLLSCAALSSYAQEQESDISGYLRFRYKSTNNDGSLADFRIGVTHGFLRYEPQLTKWLSLGIQGNALTHFGNRTVTQPDELTGIGPQFEGNLWNPRLMSGQYEFALPQSYLLFNFGLHELTIGRFVKNTPFVNAEPFPFPNALQGLWYTFQKGEAFRFETGIINQVAPRQNGRFVGIGESIGTAGQGVDVNGFPNQYRGNTEVDLLNITGLVFQPSVSTEFTVWNYYTENVTNTTIAEGRYKNKEVGWEFGAMTTYQFRVGNGGNANNDLAYKQDKRARNYSLQAIKYLGYHSLEFSVDRITKLGRLLLPREWGREPFYTFVRRTRIEGSSDVTSALIKWERIWDNKHGHFRVYSKAVRNRFPNPFELPADKNRQSTHYHLDFSVLFAPKKFQGLEAEVYLAKRVGAGDVPSLDYVINRIDFFHFDFLLTYKFGPLVNE